MIEEWLIINIGQHWGLVIGIVTLFALLMVFLISGTHLQIRIWKESSDENSSKRI